MPNYRRFYIPNAITFITCVTKDRHSYLETEKDIEIYFTTLENVQAIYPFELLAFVIMPDHFHWLIKVEVTMGNFSKVMHSIKRNFTWNYKQMHNIQKSIIIWQRGYWDHVIRDEVDLGNHLDYIHWNPIKHGYVKKPEDWPYSSFRDWILDGFYEFGWGWDSEPENINKFDFE